jgi:hypothetical protein
MRSGILKHVVLAAVIAIALYVVAFWAIEHRRSRLGPWELSFGATATGEPELIINQPRLAVRHVRLVFAEHKFPTGQPPQVVTFAQPREGAFDLPFGRCIYMDLTFLPGVVTCEFFGHEVELMPRTLVVDRQEIAWRTNVAVRILRDGTNTTFSVQRSTQNAR